MDEVQYREPFDRLQGLKKFEYEDLERETGDEPPSPKPSVEFVYRLITNIRDSQ